ncbi:MAG: cadherin repeat domain-containing protein [Balneola sp.]|nr:MAG: cadherin repeat domain-containing protein [Balneola sp.]
MSKKTGFISLLNAFLFLINGNLFSQTQLVQDYTKILSIPNVKAVGASNAHFYVLSETEGMAVFRAYQDSLQWLYTSAGMQRRGEIIEADIRFAYLYGDSKRLTVLEPTSVLGVYSSTLLPAQPLGVARLENNLYVALGSSGLGSLSLETPETVDSEAEIVANDVIGRANVLDVASSIISNQLFVLTNDSKVHVFSIEEEVLTHQSSVDLRVQLHHLFLDNGLIWGATRSGDIFEVNTNGLGNNCGNIQGRVATLVAVDEFLIAKNEFGELWSSNCSEKLQPWKTQRDANHHISKSAQTIWISAFDKISPLKQNEQTATPNQSQQVSSGEFSLKTIDNIILTYPKPLLVAIELESGVSNEEVEFTYRSNVANAAIRNQGFYWQPNPNQIGMNWFTIVATNPNGEVDSTRFSVDVRTFNSPPRFSPVRSTSIAVNDEYITTYRAIDPENPSSSLIRYLGVDLPEGANLNEQTGEFTWIPSDRQIGKHEFRIIATDEQGAAASQDISLTVLNISRQGR